MKEESRTDVRLLAGGALVGAGIGALSSGGLRKDLAANISAGKDSRLLRKLRGKAGNDASFSAEAPKQVRDEVDKILGKLRKEKGFGGRGSVGDITFAVSGPPGSGKSTFARHLAAKLNNGSVPSPVLVGEGKSKHYEYKLPRGVRIKEKTTLFSAVDPSEYDVMIKLDQPTDVLKQRLLARGRGAIQADVYDLDKMKSISSAKFDAVPGKELVKNDFLEAKITNKQRGTWDSVQGKATAGSGKLQKRIAAGILAGTGASYALQKLLSNRSRQ